jgi:phenylalanyl-tRNA synthetase alpha chain
MQNSEIIKKALESLKSKFEKLEDKKSILKDPEIKGLYDQIKLVKPEERAAFGKEVNGLKEEVESWVSGLGENKEILQPIDITAPFDVNQKSKNNLLPSTQGTLHPLMAEIETIADIYHRMGFEVMESREIDDDYHMFESLNFPDGHPARDDYDTFMTKEGYIAPAHTSVMQNRALLANKHKLEKGEPIAVVIPGRVFRNEDLDAAHEHTFYQVEGIYVDKGINVGNLVAVLRSFMSEYFGQELKAKVQPFYFPFTEPSFEFAIERPEALRKGNTEADMWLEILGCGMIHPNVLKAAGIDPEVYTGFAWGNGIDRIVMMKYDIEDVRHFESAKLSFLRQFR